MADDLEDPFPFLSDEGQAGWSYVFAADTGLGFGQFDILYEFAVDVQFQYRKKPAIDSEGFFDPAGFYQPEDRYRLGGESAYQAGDPAIGAADGPLPERLVIDASHDNSGKDPEKQFFAAGEIADQIADGNKAIVGVMLESFLVGGRQDLVPGERLTYGQSITDACMDWESTVSALERFASAVEARSS